MFTELKASDGATVDISINGRSVSVPEHITVAAALLRAGVDVFRTTPVQSNQRGPYCMMGVCFDCLVMIDGESGQQACLTPVRHNMQIDLPMGGKP